MYARSLGAVCLFALLARPALAVDPFFAPPEPSGSVQVRLCTTEVVGAGSTQLVTLGVPFPRGSVTAAGLSTVRVLKNGVEVPALVESLTPWRHLNDPTLDGASVRVARVQFRNTFASGFPSIETVTIEWGMAQRTQSLPSLTDPRSAWHTVTSGTFVGADGVLEPNVYAALPKAHLAKGILRPGRTLPFADSIAETRDDPAAVDAIEEWAGFEEQDRARKNNFYSIINEDDVRVTAANQCAYKRVGEYEPWLYDRASTMFVLYFRSGFPKALREAVRHAEFYRRHLTATGLFDIKADDDEKYCYNECLAYLHWLTGDNVPLPQFDQVASAFNSVTSRWSPTMNFWTERHTAFKLLAQTVAYEVLGGTTRADAARMTMNDVIWHQDGASGQIPANRVDGGLYHYGRQHDWDWAENTLGGSPWMSVLMVDAAVRFYAAGESPATGHFIRRFGTFERAALRVSDEHDYENAGGAVTMSVYGLLFDGTIGTAEWSDVEHALDVASTLAWAGYFADLLGFSGTAYRTDATSLYRTYSFGVNYWIRPAGPESGLPAFRVAPWRKHGWENRPSGSFSWLMGQSGSAPPNQPPSVTMTSPSNGATFTAPASFTVAASAGDTDGTVTRVEFFRGSTLLATDTTAPYDFAVTGLAAGTWSFTARATDDRGATTTSSAISVTVNTTANVPPSVSISSPVSGARLTAPITFNLNASASDTDGTISRVEYYRGAKLLGTAIRSPYALTMYQLAPGTYEFTARAYDNRGASTTSTTILVTVVASGGGPDPGPGPAVRVLVSYRNGYEGYNRTKDLSISTLGASESWNGGHGTTTDGAQLPCYQTVGDGAYEARALVRFDALRVPSGSTVLWSYLRLTVDTWDTGFTVRGRYFRVPWVAMATRTTWLQRNTGIRWGTPGATGVGTDVWSGKSFALTGFTGTGLQNLGVYLDAAVVQSWVDNAANDVGVILVNEGAGKIANFLASQYSVPSRRPYLAILYQP
ncbi:MAG: Ig-like domain-containing protein [Planctomycetota bacterium]